MRRARQRRRQRTGGGEPSRGPSAGGWRSCVSPQPAPAALQRMVLRGERLAIPAGELERFAEELCPALRHVATVVSSDGSFTPPEISAPTLVLRASYGAEHRVDVGWEWSYQVGASTRHTAFASNGGGPGFRDLDAERAILASADLTGDGPRALRPARRRRAARRRACDRR